VRTSSAIFGIRGRCVETGWISSYDIGQWTRKYELVSVGYLKPLG
jgi:hypothetical protein